MEFVSDGLSCGARARIQRRGVRNWAMPQSPEQLARDINCIGAWLAQDDFQGNGPGTDLLRGLDVIALLGNQVIATLTSACALMELSPKATFVLSGGAGHSTQPLYENLCTSGYCALAR